MKKPELLCGTNFELTEENLKRGIQCSGCGSTDEKNFILMEKKEKCL